MPSEWALAEANRIADRLDARNVYLREILIREVCAALDAAKAAGRAEERNDPLAFSKKVDVAVRGSYRKGMAAGRAEMRNIIVAELKDDGPACDAAIDSIMDRHGQLTVSKFVIASAVLHAAAAVVGALPVDDTQQTRWRHIRRNSTYTELGRGQLQTSDPEGLADYEDIVIYRSDADGSLWCRAVTEFEDGRFVRVTNAEEPVT